MNQETITVALIAGGLGALVGGLINLFITFIDKWYQSSSRKKDNVREDNKEIITLIADIKVSLHKIERYAHSVIQYQITYWRQYRAHELYRIAQANEQDELRDPNLNSLKKIALEGSIKSRGSKIESEIVENEKALEQANTAIHRFNDEVNTFIYKLTKLSIIASVNLSKEEALISKFSFLGFINLEEIKATIQKIESIEDINDNSKTGKNDFEQKLSEAVREYVKPVLEHISETSFKLLP